MDARTRQHNHGREMTITSAAAQSRRTAPPGLRQVPALLLRFFPYYLRHIMLQPYRPHGAASNVRELLTKPGRRHQIAVYDAVLEFMLKGYAELAGHVLRPETGQVAVMLTRIGFAFDDEYEQREAQNEPLALDQIMGSPRVVQRISEWRQFMQQFESYPAIRESLTAYVAGLYRDYTDVPAMTAGAASFETMMRSATIDSGGLLVALAHVVAQFHGAAAAGELTKEFSALGVIGKLADDVLDFGADLADGRPNLLSALAGADEDEYRRAITVAAPGKVMSARWWQRNCPRTYYQLMIAYEEHQGSLTSGWLRYTSNLMWAPALLGHRRRSETRGRI